MSKLHVKSSSCGLRKPQIGLCHKRQEKRTGTVHKSERILGFLKSHNGIMSNEKGNVSQPS